ncbi:electron transfer flavoprotein subunit alpha/FixB family protein [Devosia sp.]|uniref:electron transfer flavoprotein subunit alpha/FixB family protein n=1 Tax=Devosia sp. TaxID=1871048 RepID=UPI0035B12E47
MTTLLLAEHDNTTLDPQTAQALTAALALGRPVHVLVAGTGCGSVASAAAGLAGVERVLLAEEACYGAGLAEPLAALLVDLAAGYHAIVAAATSTGKDVLPRVAALLDVMQVSDIIAVEGPQTFRRPIYAGNAVEIVRSDDAKQVITVRASAFAAAPAGSAAEIVAVGAAGDPGLVRLIEDRSVVSDRPELTAARIVVSGGRAFGSKEQFDALLTPLAVALNAAIGASRAAVDAGYAANELQVGQTGKIVAPDLYIACGISGAIQHLAGMKDAKVIVAINSDPSAPIFQVANYGLVGDIFTLLPELTAALGPAR